MPQYQIEIFAPITAQEKNIFSQEITSITTGSEKEKIVIEKDECPRKDTSLEKLSQLKPIFRKKTY